MSSLSPLIDGLDAPWGPWVRSQGLVVMLSGDITDDGVGHVGLPALTILSPLTGSYFTVNSGSFTLGSNGALVVDLPPTTTERSAVNARVVAWVDSDRLYDNRDTLVLGARLGAGRFSWRLGGGNNITTIRKAIDLTNGAGSGTNAGNVIPDVTSRTNIESWYWRMIKDVDGDLFGEIDVPLNLAAAPNAKIALDLAGNGTGVARMIVAHKSIADGGSMNPTLTTETAVDITMPAALLRKLQLITLTVQPAAGDLMAVKITHNGAHANDTFSAADLELHKAYLVCDVI